MLILIILFSFSLTGYLIGNRFALKLTDNRRYFEECSALVESFASDLSFRQSNVCDFLVQQTINSEHLKRNVTEFCSFVKEGKEKLSLSLNFLNESEQKCIIELFSALGRYDLDTQLVLLKNSKQKIAGFYKGAQDKEKKMCSTYRKLGALLGLLIGILIV